MIPFSPGPLPVAPGSAPAIPARSVLHMRADPDGRTAGTLPVWEQRPATPAETVGARLNSAGQTKDGSFAAALAYAAQDGTTPATNPGDEFGFGDIVDMANPLQHIPVVNHLYRSITGDTIKPVSRVMGGALYAGPIGAAAGLVNIIAEYETGEDIAGNVYGMLAEGKRPSFRTKSDDPQNRLTEAVRMANAQNPQQPDLPASALAFAPPQQSAQPLHNQSTRYND